MTRKKKQPQKPGEREYAIPPPEPLSIAEPAAPSYRPEIPTARVFQSGNSQAVRLPRSFRVKSNEVLIFRRGADIVLREKPLKLSEALAGIPPLPDDFPDEIPDSPPDPIERF